MMDNGAADIVLQHLASGQPLPTKADGVSLGSIPTWIQTILTSGIFGAILLFIIRWRKQNIDRGDALDEERRGDMVGMRARIETLERSLADERRLRASDWDRYQADMSLMRHRCSNSEQCLDAIILLLKTSPDKVSEAVSAVETLRERLRRELADESATMHADRLKGDAA